MSAPSNTPLQTPSGWKMGDGYQTAVAFSRLPTASFWEKTVKPAGMDGGDKVDTTTMRNARWRAYSPRHLVTLTDLTLEVAWDPDVYTQIVNNLINGQGSISIWFPDHTSVDFFGYMSKFEPGNHVEGEMPLATITIVPTNQD